MRISRLHEKHGFTLIELMIVVAIVGVLAAVAIPSLVGYLKRSKAAEAFTILQGIREKEEAYFGEYKRYTTDLPTIPLVANCSPDNESRPWNLVPGDEWSQLGFAPDGPTYYQYDVTSPYTAAGVFQAAVGRPVDQGTTWPAASRPWFMASAFGDLDCDGDSTNFYISSANKAVFHEGEEDSIY